MLNLSKHILILIGLITILNNFTQAQDFIHDYTQFLLNNRYLVNESTRKSVMTSVDRLQSTLDRFETEQGQPFLIGDTVYMINFYAMETGFPSQIIWNGRESCYYQYTFSVVHWKVVNQKLTIETDASKDITGFKPFFKQYVLNADTSSYSSYAKAHMVFDGSSVSFTRAIRVGQHWIFTRSSSYQTNIYKDR